MHGTFDELREAHPGKWLLILLDHRESDSGTLLFAHEDHKRVGEEMKRQPKELDKERPLYMTWSIPEDGELPAFVLQLVPPAPIPGEGRIARVARKLAVIRAVRLAAGDREASTDALFDTGATYCVIPEEAAARLNLQPGERLGVERVQGVLGRATTMERYRLEHVRVGTAQVNGVDILVGEAVLSLMLLGMSFIEKFTTTLDLDEERVIFRPRTADRQIPAYRSSQAGADAASTERNVLEVDVPDQRSQQQ